MLKSDQIKITVLCCFNTCSGDSLLSVNVCYQIDLEAIDIILINEAL